MKIPEPVNRGSFSHQGQLLSPEPSANSSTNYDADRWGRALLFCKGVAPKQPFARPGNPLVHMLSPTASSVQRAAFRKHLTVMPPPMTVTGFRRQQPDEQLGCNRFHYEGR